MPVRRNRASEAAGRELAAVPLDRVVTSGLRRSVETAQLVVGSRALTLESIPELREIRRDLASNREQTRRRVERELERLRESRDLSRELLRQARRHHASIAGLHHDDHAGDGVWAGEGEADDAAAEWLSAAVDGVED